MRGERRRGLTACLALLLGMGAAACDPSRSGTGSDRDAIAVRDSAGVTIVENTEADPTDVAKWTVDTTPSVTIGVSMGDPAYELNRVGGVQRLPNGMIVLTNGSGESAVELRFYDSTGKHIATHGRLGQGPGEHRWITFFGSAGGDTVIAMDFPNGRINWVSASAGFLRASRVIDNGFKKVLGDDATGSLENLVPFGDSVYAVKAYRAIPNDVAFRRWTTYQVVDLAARTAAEVASYDDPEMKQVRLSSGRTTSVWPRSAGSPVHVVDRARKRLCAAVTTTTEVSCVDAAGNRRRIRWRVDPIPYTSEDRRAFEESFRKTRMTERGMTQGDVEMLLAAMDQPEHQLPFNVLQIDLGGNFWVLEYVRDPSGERRTRFRVFDPDGRHIAFADPFPVRNVSLSNSVHIGTISVLRVYRDADDVAIVGVFRIRKPE